MKSFILSAFSKNVPFYFIRYMTTKDSKYVKFNSENPLYLFFGKVNGHFEEINRKKYLMLVPANESKEKIKNYEELQSKIRYLIRSVTKISDDYDEKYMKIKFNSHDELPPTKMIEIPSMIIVVKLFFLKIINIISKLSQMNVCINYSYYYLLLSHKI